MPSGVSIKNAQAAFKQLGYDPGPIDNVYGRATRNAVMRFQRAQHLPVTGILDEQTWSAIVGQLVPQRGRR
ncbi:MAG TPA: peptidoglycan-binding domain-containing protein [Kofleriaceae bacterium]|nr:peptidoglycan-binding domain-containing protein [Kofleriaceae bacterium]